MRRTSAEDVRSLQQAMAGRPEIALLAWCARTSIDEGDRRQLSDVLSGILDWNGVLTSAEVHGILPLLHRHLGRHADVPDGIQRQLEQAARQNARRSLLLASRLLEIVATFSARGIATRPFKGPDFAAQAYGNVALRQSVDLDLFVRRCDVVRAHAALLELGFNGHFPECDAAQRRFIDSQYEIELRGPDGLQVDLHWGVVLRRYAIDLDVDEMWLRGEVGTFAGKPISRFATEDLLLLLCVHGAKHKWRRMGWISDVAQLIQSAPDIAWDEVRARARQAGAERMVRLGLLLATCVTAAAIPSDIERWIGQDPAAEALAVEVVNAYEPRGGGPPDVVGLARFHLAARERTRDKLRYIWRSGVTPTIADWHVMSLPEPLAFLYTFVHPLRLVAKYGARAFQSGRAS